MPQTLSIKRLRTLVSFLLIFALGIIIINACRKTDQRAEENTISETENKFFNEHRSDDPLVQAINIYFKKFNSKHQFVGKTVNQIGFPYWDKSMTFAKTDENSAGRGNSGDSVSVTYIPFVRDSQQFVNASLLVKTTPSDTSFQYLCDWQYAEFGFDTAQTGWNARNVFHVFTLLDKNVFGRTKFRVTDENLLTEDQNNYLDSLGLSFDSVEVVFNFLQPSQKTTLGRGNLLMPVTVCNDVVGCVKTHMMAFRSGRGQIQPAPDICPPGETPMVFTICTDIWVYIPSGNNGSGGSGGGGSTGGGGGSGGGGTPPECGSTLPGRTNLVDPCGPGWEPVEENPSELEQLLLQWDNNIIIHTSVRPCISAIINSVKNIRSGAIASMIFILSQEIPAFNWEIKEVQQLPAPYTSADALTTINNFFTYATTELNISKIANATNISIARTILHEAVHAFIFNFINNQAQLTQSQKDQILELPFAKKIKEFLKIKYPSPTYNNQFHNLMAKHFHDAIRDGLKELCPQLGITLTGIDLDIFCSDMAWGGMQDEDSDSPWMDPNILTDEDRARIIKRLDIELNNLPGFSGNVQSGGSNYFISLTRIGTKACP